MVTYKEVSNEGKYHEWHNYEPHDIQYMRYAEENPSAVAAGFKIGDVYKVFAFAKASLMFSMEEDYGDLAAKDSEISKLTVKYMFVQNAISQYAICEDLSWQVVWAYIQPSDIEYLMNDEFQKMEKTCDRDNLLAQLDCGISQKVLAAQKLKDIVTKFDNDEEVMKFRTLNNYLKHRGTLHIEGLGEQDKALMGCVNGQFIGMLSRKSYTLNELQETIWVFHKKFEEYFNEIIEVIMPEDFCNNKIDAISGLNALLKMASVQK